MILNILDFLVTVNNSIMQGKTVVKNYVFAEFRQRGFEHFRLVWLFL